MVKREHELVPVHRIMSASEIEELLETMGVRLSNLPRMLVTDPQVKKLGAKPGDLLEIQREDFGKHYKYYRQVVES